MSNKERKKQIIKHLVDTVGGIPEINRYVDEKEISSIYIMIIKDIPEKGVNLYSTIGTSEYTIGLTVDKLPLRVELIFTADKKNEEVPNMLATSAFCIINSGFKCYPGAIFYDIIKSYLKDTDMKHVMFVEPFLWEDRLRELKFDDKIIEWLLVVPISEKESRYAEEQGSEALEDLFEESEIDIFNLYRKSII